nr:hypothetical protein CFP56_71912 [Quercus suber]
MQSRNRRPYAPGPKVNTLPWVKVNTSPAGRTRSFSPRFVKNATRAKQRWPWQMHFSPSPRNYAYVHMRRAASKGVSCSTIPSLSRPSKPCRGVLHATHHDMKRAGRPYACVCRNLIGLVPNTQRHHQMHRSQVQSIATLRCRTPWQAFSTHASTTVVLLSAAHCAAYSLAIASSSSDLSRSDVGRSILIYTESISRRMLLHEAPDVAYFLPSEVLALRLANFCRIWQDCKVASTGVSAIHCTDLLTMMMPMAISATPFASRDAMIE